MQSMLLMPLMRSTPGFWVPDLGGQTLQKEDPLPG